MPATWGRGSMKIGEYPAHCDKHMYAIRCMFKAWTHAKKWHEYWILVVDLHSELAEHSSSISELLNECGTDA